MDINARVARRLKVSSIGRPVGIAVYRATQRLAPSGPGPRVMVNSLPKSGSHLLMSLLDAVPGMAYSGRHCTFSENDLTGERGRLRAAEVVREMGRAGRSRYLTGHLAYRPDLAEAMRREGLATIHVTRDPRALVVSTAKFIRSNTRHPLHGLAGELFADEAALVEAIVAGFASDDGSLRYVGVRERWSHFVPWTTVPGTLTVRFEDLVGGRGGGDADRQRQSISEVLAFVGRPEVGVEQVAAAAFDTRSATFRSGRVDSWRDELPPHVQAAVLEACGDLVAPFGYTA